MKKFVLILTIMLLSGCVNEKVIQVEYGSDSQYDIDTFKLGEQRIDNKTIVEVVDTQMPVFTKEVDEIDNFSLDTDLNKYFEGEDAVDGRLEVQLKSVDKEEIEVIITDENGNTAEKKVKIKLDDSIKALTDKEIKAQFDHRIIELPKPILPKEEDE